MADLAHRAWQHESATQRRQSLQQWYPGQSDGSHLYPHLQQPHPFPAAEPPLWGGGPAHELAGGVSPEQQGLEEWSVRHSRLLLAPHPLSHPHRADECASYRPLLEYSASSMPAIRALRHLLHSTSAVYHTRRALHRLLSWGWDPHSANSRRHRRQMGDRSDGVPVRAARARPRPGSQDRRCNMLVGPPRRRQPRSGKALPRVLRCFGAVHRIPVHCGATLLFSATPRTGTLTVETSRP